MGQTQAPPLVQEARSLLQLFMNLSENELMRHADDILMYFRKLHELNIIVRIGILEEIFSLKGYGER